MSAGEDTATNYFQLFFEKGYKHLVSVIPPGVEICPDIANYKGVVGSRGKCPGVLTDKGWRPYRWYDPEAFEPHRDIVRWHKQGSSIGLLAVGGLFALDVDCYDPALSAQLVALCWERLGKAPVRTGRMPKALLMYRLATPADVERAKYTALTFKDTTGTKSNAAVEVLILRQFVVKGPYPVEPGEEPHDYFWDGKLPAFEDLPAVTWDQIEALLEEMRAIVPEPGKRATKGAAINRGSVKQEELIGRPEWVETLVSEIPNTGRYETMIEMAAAIRGACQDHDDLGLGLFLDWCARWELDTCDLEQCEREFYSLTAPFALGVQRLEYMAGPGLYLGRDGSAPGNGIGGTDAIVRIDPQRFLSDIPPSLSDVEEAIVALHKVRPEAELARSEDYADIFAPEKKEPRPALVFRSFDEIADESDEDDAPALVEELLDVGAMTVLYGASNAGKTFVAVWLAYCIAKGIPFGGCETLKRRVAYVAAEGGKGIKNRVNALRRTYGSPDDGQFHMLTSGVDLFDPEADLKPLIAKLLAMGDVGLLVLDTLARIMAGGDENTSQDMGKLVANVDKIRHATGAHVLIVHHSGKDASKGARGSSALRAATDTEIEVLAPEEDETHGHIEATKQRDLEMSFKRRFKLVGVALGVRANGKPKGSAVCEIETTVATRPVPVEAVMAAGAEREVVEAVQTLLGAAKVHGQPGVKLASVVAHLNGSVTAGMVRKYLDRAIARGAILKAAKGMYLPGAPVAPMLLTPIEDEKIEADNSSDEGLFD